MKQYLNTINILLSTLIISCGSSQSDLSNGLYAEINTNKGDILVSLSFEKTPVTVANFVSLSEGKNKNVNTEYKKKRYYDGLKFHRVIDNFMIQGGDPLGTGQGGPGYKFKDEFDEILKHTVLEYCLWQMLDQTLMEVSFLLHIKKPLGLMGYTQFLEK